MRKLILFLFLIYAVACKKKFGKNLREKTDKYIFKEAKGADKRASIQTVARDLVHGVYHTRSRIGDVMKGRKKEAKDDFSRPKQHFAGKNYHQSKKSSGGGGAF